MEAVTRPVYPNNFFDRSKICSLVTREKRKTAEREEALVQVRICTKVFYVLTDSISQMTSCMYIVHATEINSLAEMKCKM